MIPLYLDFETRSRCDLETRGTYNYAQDASTDVLCMSYAFGDDDVVTWLPGQPFPEAVRNHKGLIYAHNAAFERLIFWYVLQIDFDLTQFYCTATQARANCLPASLEDVGRAVSSKMRKDHRGGQLIRLLSIPQADGTFNDDPVLMDEMIRYCEQDVRTMRAVSQSLRPLSDQELADYHVSERVNDRGVLVDVPLCRAAMAYASDETAEIQAEVFELTDGEITTVRSPKLRKWVLDRIGPEALKMTVVYKDGEKKASIDKSVRANLLAFAEENPDEVPSVVADVIQCTDDLWASSTAKFARFAAIADEEDHRVRGAFVFAGGAATGRYASYGIQVHNLPRKAAKDALAVREALVHAQPIVPQFGKRVSDVLKGMLRPAMVPKPGHVFVVSDWSAIEGRVNPWLAKSDAGEAKLDVFRAKKDPYIVNAAATFRVGYDEVQPEQRQVGKVQELACFSAETKVLTSNGVKAILDVSCDDLLWDGVEWVRHQGVVARGLRRTIRVCGIRVTPEHLMLTGQTWMLAQQLASNKPLRTLALATGSENLPFWVANELSKVPLGCDTQECSARAVPRRTSFIFITCVKGLRHGATYVLRSLLDSGAKISTSTRTLALTTPTGDGYLTACPPARTGATTQKIADTQTMVGEGSNYTSRGAKTKLRFCNMFSLLMDGINRAWRWTGSTLIRGMSRVTCGSLRNKPIARISERFSVCSDTSSNLNPVFDILNSGSRNRFAVVADEGVLIAHNCGFSGGVGAFASMGRIYGIAIDDVQANLFVHGWRRANPWAMPWWQQLENAYTRAMRNKGREFSAGRVTYMYDGQHLWYALPSGRVLCYPFARFDEDGAISYLKASWKPAADAKEWPRGRLWRGLACENITQAAANDLLRHVLWQYEDCAVLHCHDEIVLEAPIELAEEWGRELERAMTTPPKWAEGLPLAVEWKILTRYGK